MKADKVRQGNGAAAMISGVEGKEFNVITVAQVVLCV